MSRVVFQSADEFGPIVVVEDALVRRLHFRGNDEQSSCLIHDPDHLEMAYLRAMAGALLLCPTPQRVLLLGLGGGGLARYLLTALPAVRIDALELRPAVVAVARDWFGLPADRRLSVHCTDALEFIAAAPEKAWDLVLVDLYLDGGLAVSTAGPLLVDCRRLLRTGGVLALNLWREPLRDLEATLERLDGLFAGAVVHLPVPDMTNVIAFAVHGRLPRRNALARRAAALPTWPAVEWSRWLRLLAEHNFARL